VWSRLARHGQVCGVCCTPFLWWACARMPRGGLVRQWDPVLRGADTALPHHARSKRDRIRLRSAVGVRARA
jgi:hypothetical protein